MDKKSRIKEGLKLGKFVMIVSILSALTSNFFNHKPLTLNRTIGIIVSALLVGCAAGFLNFWLLKRYGNNDRLMRTAKINLENDEMVLFETVANHFKGIEAVGGKLYLTNNRLVFKSHKFNFQNHELSISLSDIIKVNKYKPLGIANTGLSVTTDENKTEKFVVQKREEWMNQLQEKTRLLQV